MQQGQGGDGNWGGTIQVMGTACVRAQRLKGAWHAEEEEKARLVRKREGG